MGGFSNSTKERILGDVKGKLREKKYSFTKGRLCQTHLAAFFGNNCIIDFIGERKAIDLIDLDFRFHIT